jgi:hypothetical protein
MFNINQDTGYNYKLDRKNARNAIVDRNKKTLKINNLLPFFQQLKRKSNDFITVNKIPKSRKKELFKLLKKDEKVALTAKIKLKD